MVYTNSGIPKQLTIQYVVLEGVKAQQIYYRALTEYLSSNSNFSDAKEALYQSALDLYDKTQLTK